MRRLAVGLWSDEHVDADLESGRLMDDLVPTALGGQPLGGPSNVEVLHERERTTLTSARRAAAGSRRPRWHRLWHTVRPGTSTVEAWLDSHSP